ncbi:MAG: hypothetical protein V1703_02500 [Candidatus Altiarchaeota archaeon]
MTESGKKLDRLANDFESKVVKLKGFFSVEETSWAEIKGLKAERDKFNNTVKDLSSRGKRLRSERNKLNDSVASLKQKRAELIEKIKKLRGDAKVFVDERKTLSKDAGGLSGKIVLKLNKIFNQLLCEEMFLEKEQKLFEDAISISQKLDIAMKADEIHSSVLSKYGEIAAIENEVNTISEEIRCTAREAEEKHVGSLKVYSELDSIRKQSDEFHKKLLLKYEELKPIRDKINALKDEIKLTEDEMDTVYSTLAKSRESSITKKRAEKISEAKEKLKTGKRISFDDFKSIIESESLTSEP